jgi:hypothetical protein
MASEDSDQVSSGCPAVHCLCYFRNFNETLRTTMQVLINHADTAGKAFKVASLCRMQRMSLKERNYRSQKINSTIDNELSQVLTMVVVPLCDVHATKAKKSSVALQALIARCSLASRQTGVQPGSQSCSPSGSSGLVAGRNQWRSIPLRLQTQPPSRAESVFPADCLHSSHCHGTAHMGRNS